MSMTPHRWALLWSSVVLAGSTTSCGRTHGSSPQFSVPPLEVVLSEPVLWRDPAQEPAFQTEDNFLHLYDDEVEGLTARARRNTSYESWINEALDRVGVDLHYRVIVTEDFRLSGWLESVAGGVTGHELIVLDGKLLDILLEYSTFIALWERGDIRRDPVEAVDEIVLLHNDFLGETTGGFLYRYWDVDLDVALRADTHFLRFVSALVYHEFGHLYLGHVLAALRRDGDLETLRPPDPIDEDDADLVSGMLVAKAGRDLFSAQELLDVMCFALEQRFDRNLTYWDVLSPGFQDASPGGGYSSLSFRKQTVLEGFDRYAWQNF